MRADATGYATGVASRCATQQATLSCSESDCAAAAVNVCLQVLLGSRQNRKAAVPVSTLETAENSCTALLLLLLLLPCRMQVLLGARQKRQAAVPVSRLL
jgi:hypothetical protein